MKIEEVNGEKFEQAQVISRGKTYRLCLFPKSETITAKSYYFMTGWTFTIGNTEEEVTYSGSELKDRLNSGTVWEKI